MSAQRELRRGKLWSAAACCRFPSLEACFWRQQFGRDECAPTIREYRRAISGWMSFRAQRGISLCAEVDRSPRRSTGIGARKNQSEIPRCARNDIKAAASCRTPKRFAPATFRKRSVFCLAALLFAVLAFARDFPPEALPRKPLVLPAPALRVLPNGLKVVAIERHLLPLLTLRLVVKSGAESDPVSLPGTAQLVSALLTEGTSTRSASQISEAIDSIGGLVDAGADWMNPT